MRIVKKSLDSQLNSVVGFEERSRSFGAQEQVAIVVEIKVDDVV